jgi:hypothetical protein
MKARWDDGDGFDQDRAIGWPDDTYLWRFPGPAERRCHRHCDLHRRCDRAGGKRKAKHHQWLTDDVGNPALSQHLHAVITLMRVSRTWNQFKLMLDQAHPKRGDTLQLPLMLEGPDMPPAKIKKVEQKSLFDATE